MAAQKAAAFDQVAPRANKVIQGLVQALPGLLAAAVVQTESGVTLAQHSTTDQLNPATAAAYNAEVVRQKQKAMSALQLTGETIDDILISLSTQLHLIKLSADGSQFIYLVANAQDTNLGLAREALRHSMEELE
ncbi:hypothetical protein [Hymenobacter cellulosivorans]|uniref:Roadblock/LAMTOR2 domain-containing protein n=1 Tax=Hymenobacter cellulosivorans TaxID=2932249 RepID=A0ABY4FB15_9BACT|nr:hypothetical protein [Hymenobacter cellulosivorans]UOQ53715.1 hypothetical protein MUN80_02900 [Hymenobacter cellulosivorans]